MFCHLYCRDLTEQSNKLQSLVLYLPQTVRGTQEARSPRRFTCLLLGPLLRWAIAPRGKGYSVDGVLFYRRSCAGQALSDTGIVHKFCSQQRLADFISYQVYTVL